MMLRIPVLLVLLLLVSGSVISQPDNAALEKWFASDDMALPESSGEDVNEGELAFISASPGSRVHHHQNKMIIDAYSLKNGWVKIQQCHEHLDRVGRAQIVFRKEKVRQLKIVSALNIEQAWVSDNTIQLTNILENAKLCLSAVSQALKANPDGSFSLKNGPFMRRFLDGYYPMHVSMDISLVGSGLQLVSVLPVAQPGFQVWKRPGRVGYEAWFEGKLMTELRFSLLNE